MKYQAVLFDLDGTLLPMDTDKFIEIYFRDISTMVAPLGYDPKMVLKALWAGVGAMTGNDGSVSNEEVFWRVFASYFDNDAKELIPVFENYYANDFVHTTAACQLDDKSRLLVEELKRRGYRLICATNPIFPAVATKQRLAWLGLSFADFELVTTYENCGFAKPNPAYYRYIADKCALDMNKCLMVGNDVDEDMVAKELGFDVFLADRYLLNKHNKDISIYPRGDLQQLLTILD